MDRAEDASRFEKVVEAAGEACEGSVSQVSTEIGEFDTVDARVISPVGVSGSEIDEFSVRRSRWVNAIQATTLRRRVLHDIVPCEDESGAIRLFKKLKDRVQCNARGSGFITIAVHLCGPRSHVHVVHDCAWASTSCKDVFLQGIPIKSRQPRYNPWTAELPAKYWDNLFYYLFGRGRR